MERIEANGFAFDADVVGPDDGELVLLLHGFPQTRHTWRAELPALAAAGFRGCAPDQRGYSPGARPSGAEAYRTDLLVGDALAIADVLGAERFHLVGHDWGGQLAWLLAAQHPERVRTLAVLSRPHPAAFVQALAEDPAQAQRSGHHRAFQRPEAADELLADDAARLRGLFGTMPDVEVYLETVGDRAALDAALHWYRAGGGAGLAAGDLPPASMPTLYVWGDEDATVGRLAAERTREFVTGPYRFVELPGVGHFVTDQAPGVFPPLLLQHLAT